MNNSVKFICIFNPLTYTRRDFLRKWNIQINKYFCIYTIFDNNNEYIRKEIFNTTKRNIGKWQTRIRN